MSKMYEWTAKIKVADVWVADGFELTSERLHEMLMKEIGWCYPSEVDAEVITFPDPQEIKKEQGY